MTYIAVIDDDESLCRSMSRLLLSAHFQPVCYLSAEDFLLDTKHPEFDCILLDIQLKGMSGLELKRRLSAVQNDTPVIFITAHDDPAMRAETEALNCAGYFRKTDSGVDILEAIRRITGLADSSRVIGAV